MSDKPKCFSTRTWVLWLNANASLPAKARETHCRDCLPSYQLRMKKLGLCDSPEVMFSFEDGAAVGLA